MAGRSDPCDSAGRINFIIFLILMAAQSIFYVEMKGVDHEQRDEKDGKGVGRGARLEHRGGSQVDAGRLTDRKPPGVPGDGKGGGKMIYVKKKNFLRVLAQASKLKTGIRLTCYNGSSLRVSAMDRDVFLTAYLPAESDGAFDVVLDRKPLVSAVKNSSGEGIRIKVDGSVARVGVVQMPYGAGSDFPLKPCFPDTLDDVIHMAEELAVAVKRTVIAKDGGGILFEAGGRMVSTDGRRLSVYQLKERGQNWKAVFPRRAFEIAAGVLEKGQHVRVELYDNLGRISCGGVAVIARLISENEFPPYEKVMKLCGGLSVFLPRSKFTKAVKQVAGLYRGKETPSMVLSFLEGEEMLISDMFKGVGACDVKIHASFNPALVGMVVTLNPFYVLDWLKVLDKKSTADLVMEVHAEKDECTKQVTFRDGADERFTYVLAPITK